MHALSEALVLLAWLVVSGLAPGAAAACVLGAELRGHVERLMVLVAASMTLLGGAIFVLLWCGLYQRWTAVALPAACCAYLAWLVMRRDARWSRLMAAPADESAGATWPDHIALGVCGAWIALGFVSALTSPPTWWDASIHWDKWAADWGRRTHLHNYPYAYPQALPMFTSLAYKLAGDGGQILPSSAFAVHALHPLLALVLMLALVRLALAFRIPRWSLLLAVFGSQTVREHVTAGGVDLYLATMTTAAGALMVTVLREPERVPGRRRLALLLLGGALAIKPTGLVATLVGLATLAAWRAWPPAGVRLFECSRAAMLRLALVPLLLAAPFYAWALYADLTYRLERLDPRELHYLFMEMGPILVRATAQGQPQTESAGQALLETIGRPVVGYGVPRALLVPALVALLIVLAAAARERRSRGLLVPVLAYLAVWTMFLSYDVRNLMPALPFLGVALACGLEHLRAAAVPLGRRTLGVATLVIAVFPVWSLLDDAVRTCASLASGPQSLSRRVHAMASDVETKIATYFADEWGDWAFITHTGLARRATNVIAAGPLYRFFAHGAYPVSIFWWGQIRPGDVYVNYTWLDGGPPEIHNWFLVRTTGVRRTYVYGPDSKLVPLDHLWATGPHPPRTRTTSPTRLVVRYSGPDSLIAYNALNERPVPGSLVFWQIVADGRDPDARIRPAAVPYDPSIIDWSRTSFAVDRRSDGYLTYSGLVTLAHVPLSTDWRAVLLVGAASDEFGARLRVREFRIRIVAP